MEVLAVTCSDIHLTLTAPISRSAEPNWLAAQERMLDQLKEVSRNYNAPIIYAGDIFHKHNASPELINWAAKKLPWGYAVPGQHDLPHHVYADMEKSAYWTLCRIGTINHLRYKKPHFIEYDTFEKPLVMHGFPWGCNIEFTKDAPLDHDPKSVHVAVIHKYIWVSGKTYVGAPKEEKLSAYKKELEGFDAAVFGDNHKGFYGESGDCKVINNGCLIRRRADELHYEPFVGLICIDDEGDVYVEPEFLDTSQDLWSIDESMSTDAEAIKEELGEFLKELKSLSSDEYNFRDAVSHYLATHEVSEGVRGILMDVLED